MFSHGYPDDDEDDDEYGYDDDEYGNDDAGMESYEDTEDFGDDDDDDDNDGGGYRPHPVTKQPVVTFDWLLSDEAINSIKKWHISPKRAPPGKTSKPRKPLPQKAKVDGNWKYVAFVPPWTAPNYEERTTMDIQDSGQPRAMPRRDISRRIRPAILPRDAIRNPTPCALRFGINPTAPEGRSRMSPEPSETRRIGLSRVQNTATGAKNYINYADVQAEAANLGGVDKLAAALEAMPETDSQFEQCRAMVDFLEMLKDDKDYQRFFLQDMPIDERINSNSFTLDPDRVAQSTLSGELHPQVSPRRHGTGMLLTIKQSVQEKPMAVYGRQGQYCQGAQIHVQPVRTAWRVFRGIRPLSAGTADVESVGTAGADRVLA